MQWVHTFLSIYGPSGVLATLVLAIWHWLVSVLILCISCTWWRPYSLYALILGRGKLGEMLSGVVGRGQKCGGIASLLSDGLIPCSYQLVLERHCATLKEHTSVTTIGRLLPISVSWQRAKKQIPDLVGSCVDFPSTTPGLFLLVRGVAYSCKQKHTLKRKGLSASPALLLPGSLPMAAF